mgnify:CR=1 FL=1
MQKILLLVLAFCTLSSSGQVNLNSGLVAYFPFNGNANDVSGNNINGIVNNAILTADRNGQPNSAYYFDGSSSYIQLPYSPLYNFTPTDSFTISVRVLPDQGYFWPAQAIVVKSPFQSDFNLSNWNYGTYILNYEAMTGYAANSVLVGSTSFTGRTCWYTIIVTYKNGIWKLYVDGSLEGSDVSQTRFILQDGPASKIAFGRKGDSNGDWYKGKMDDIRIYHRVLNQAEIDSLSNCNDNIPTSCNNWLNTPAQNSYVSIGDLDISGTQLTVEALVNRTQPYTPGTGNNNDGDIVSKHTGPNDVNYLLRPEHAYITTTNGFFATPDACKFDLNKTYHVAMVYDGSSLKFYRNGFLLSQVAASGNLFQNNLVTRIGRYTGVTTENFLGYINEVRIWNVARTQTQLRTFMNSSLPTPASQLGLQAYYTFDNLINKQGNTAWNGVLSGAAVINATNPDCNTVSDSCKLNAVIGNIINDYTPVTGFAPCTNGITVEDASHFNTGDTVLIIQMKGALIDSTNTASFGAVLNYKNAGNYEYNYVKSISGNIINLKNKLTRQYDIPDGKVQLVRVPYYQSAIVSNTLTCLPWDGKKGGILAFNVRDTITLNADLDVTGKGFRGGNTYVFGDAVLSCFTDDYFLDSMSTTSSRKGEGITNLLPGKLNGRGPLANGGGGGNGHNSGGGGGGNGTTGGFGGYQLFQCSSSFHDNRGIGGTTLTYSNATNKIFLGGGGGAGHKDGFPSPPVPLSSAGGDGGGIIIVSSGYLKSNGHTIIADGAHGKQCDLDGFTCLHDGMGGGGAGGTILLNINNYLDNHKEKVSGGKGADLILYNSAAGEVAPGGGGSGGVVWFKSPTLPANATIQNNGGVNGTIVLDGNNAHGSTSGLNGINLFSLAIPIDITPFQPNIDSVRIKDSLTACRSVNFNGFGYTNTNPINTWHWNFGDAATATTQNASHTYSAAGTYNVTLVVTDINGCKDSTTKTINVINCQVDISNIINDYTPVISFNPCENKITVENGTKYNPGDTVLIIQMKGAVIDSTNTAAFGTITDYKNAGNYEFNYVKSKTGNVIELKNKVTRQYDLPNGKVQLIRVPYYNNANISNTLTCLPWNGSVGGVLVFHVKDTLTMNANLDVSAKGFRGGVNGNNLTNTWNCFAADYSYPAGNPLGAPKGEGIAVITNTGGRGALANGGGGGQDHNSGGAGGGNGNLGGFGGYQYEACVGSTPPYDNRGMQGKKLDYSNTQNRIFLGGGGGSGHANNAAGFEPDGANGGGIIIVQAGTIINNNFSILSNGGNAVTCTANSANNNCNEAMGGGGAGGTILLKSNTYLNNLPVKANGGTGADVSFSWPPAPGNPNKHGPGGGGGGGIIWLSQGTAPVNISTSLVGGINGLNTGYGNDPWGSTAGQNGISVLNLKLPIDTILFKTNIDSVRIKDSSTACRSFNFQGFGYTNTNPIASWHWDFGDNGSASTQNTSHTYASNGTYNVTLVITDINGCKDSIVKPVSSNALTVDAGLDTTFCTSGTVTVQLHGTNAGGASINWTPAGVLSNSTSLSPTATINTTTTFYLNATATGGCTGRDSVTIYVNPAPAVNTIGNTTLCESDSVHLITSGASTYHWQPGTLVTDSLSANPWHIGTGSNVTLIVTGTSSSGCTATDTVTITGLPKPNVRSIGDTILCNNPTPITLVTTGALTYSWSPAANLDNPSSSSPVFNGTSSQTYYVTGTGANGCKAKDTVNISVKTTGSFIAPPGKTLCKGDTVHLNGNNGTLVLYLWSPADHLSSTSIINPIANPDISTLYSVTVTDTTCNLDTTFKVFVDVKPLPSIIAQKSNDINCAKKSSQLTATGGIQYTWDASPSLSSTSIANPIATPTANTIYTVTGTDNNGCSNKDTVAVLVKNGFTAYGVYNSFTPNGDGLNDCFGIKHWGDASSIYFIIYNRWGEKVFQTTNPNDCWDGKYKGVPAEAGNYVFYVKGFTPCGWIERKGNVMLIR